MDNQFQEVKFVSEVITVLRDISVKDNRQKILLTVKDGFIQEMLVKFFQMDASRLLIERRTCSSYHKVNILFLINLRISFPRAITFSRSLSMEIVYKIM